MLRRISRTIQIFTIGFLLIALGFALGNSIAPSDAANIQVVQAPIEPVSYIDSIPLTDTDRIFTDVYSKVAPGVVAITVQGETVFDGSTGSGFLIDMEGHIVTNFHVVDGGEDIEVRMFDGTITRAEIVGLDPDSDLAVIQINVNPEVLHPIPLGNSNNLVVGQTVLALGSPFANDWTLTSGIISALNRSIIGLNDYSIGGVIQTDAAINPGNSGGPLLNLNGEIVGVNSQIQSEQRVNSGVGFSIPSNLVVRVTTDLIADGAVAYSYLGISSRPINLGLIEEFSLPNNLRGVAVREVQNNSPAAIAGLKTIGSSVDVITAINGVDIQDFDELIGYLSINTRPGETVNLTVYRQGQLIEVPLELTSRPN